MDENIKLEDCYDGVAKCKKCGIKYGYDIPSKFKKKILGKVKIKLGYVDSGLCPNCDPQWKEKPKGLNTHVY